jgi:hypothetical protein
MKTLFIIKHLIVNCRKSYCVRLNERGENHMAISIDAHEDRRSWKRYIVLLTGRYLLNNDKRHKECMVIDISRQGACIKTPNENKISRGDSICLEMFTKGTTSIVIDATVQWTKQIEHGLLMGIKFAALLDAQAYDILQGLSGDTSCV